MPLNCSLKIIKMVNLSLHLPQHSRVSALNGSFYCHKSSWDNIMKRVNTGLGKYLPGTLL